MKINTPASIRVIFAISMVALFALILSGCDQSRFVHPTVRAYNVTIMAQGVLWHRQHDGYVELKIRVQNANDHEFRLQSFSFEMKIGDNIRHIVFLNTARRGNITGLRQDLWLDPHSITTVRLVTFLHPRSPKIYTQFATVRFENMLIYRQLPR